MTTSQPKDCPHQETTIFRFRKCCFRCGRRRLLKFFYKDRRMADGHLGKCIDCTKSDVAANYAIRRETRSAYEAARAKDPARRAQQARNLRKYRRGHPDRARAHAAVSYALRAGKLVRGPCRFCGTSVRVQAHHADYSRPLEVLWECFKCHREHEHGQVVVTLWR
jgi:hypothetical protein